jgi:hypothetical protein
MWDFSDAHDLLNQSFNVAREMVREIFTGEVGDPIAPLPPQHDAGDAEPGERIQLDENPILNDSNGKELSFIEHAKSTSQVSDSESTQEESPKKRNSTLKDTWEESDSSDDTLAPEQQADFEKLQLLADQAQAMTEGFQNCKLSGTSLAEFKQEAKALDGQLVALFMKLSGARKDVLKPFLLKVRKTRNDLVRLAAKTMDNEAKTASSPVTPPVNEYKFRTSHPTG